MLVSEVRAEVHQSYLFSMVSLYNPVSVNEIVTDRNDLFLMHVTNVCDRLKSENKREQKGIFFFHCFGLF